MIFILEEFPTPTEYSIAGRGIRHLTDHALEDPVRFLCGYTAVQEIIQLPNPDDRACQKCASAEHGEARIHRLTH